jgi:FOG: Glucan-binding domain (YG repeat)
MKKMTKVVLILAASLVTTIPSLAAWKQQGSNWIYTNNNGSKVTGWLKDNSQWYYMDNSGIMKTGWMKEGNTSYYLDSNGSMATGWRNLNGKWYYFNSSGAMRKGWLQDSGNWYFLKFENGEMLANDYAIDGHYVDSSGAWSVDRTWNEVAKAHDFPTNVEAITRTTYIRNWSTDWQRNFAGYGVNDNKITAVIAGQENISALNDKEIEVYSVVKTFMDNNIKDTDSEYDKVVKITKFIWGKAKYDTNKENVNATGQVIVGGPYAILIAGKGICSDYAKTFKMLANIAGLESYHIGSMRAWHEWNLVRVEDEWYHIDTTEMAIGNKPEWAKFMLKNDDDFVLSPYVDNDVIYPRRNGTKYTISAIIEKTGEAAPPISYSNMLR